MSSHYLLANTINIKANWTMLDENDPATHAAPTMNPHIIMETPVPNRRPTSPAKRPNGVRYRKIKSLNRHRIFVNYKNTVFGRALRDDVVQKH